MAEKNNNEKSSLVEQHALGRLDKVQEEKRREYKKKPSEFHLSHFLLIVLMLVIVAFMIFTMTKQ